MAKITKAQYGSSTPIPRGTKSLPKPKTNPKFEMDMEKKKNLESFLKMGRGSKLKKGGKIRKAQAGDKMFPGGKKRTSPNTESPIKKGPYMFEKNVPSREQMRKDFQKREREMTTRKPGPNDRMPLKKGGSFPDLNKDGKITKADILKGRGVIAKKGMKVKKAQTGKTIKQSNADMMKEIDAREKRIAARDSANQRKSYTNERANKVVGKNKMGGMTKKCAYGCK